MNVFYQERLDKVARCIQKAVDQETEKIPIKDRDAILVSDIMKSNRWCYCLKCQIPMKVQKNDVDIVTNSYTNGAHTDTFQCPECECLISQAKTFWY